MTMSPPIDESAKIKIYFTPTHMPVSQEYIIVLSIATLQSATKYAFCINHHRRYTSPKINYLMSLDTLS